MIKRELINRVAKATRHKVDDVRPVVQKTLDYIADALAEGETIEIRDFGVFKPKVRKKRIGRYPKEPKNDIVIPEHVAVNFRAGKALKDRVNKLDTAKL